MAVFEVELLTRGCISSLWAANHQSDYMIFMGTFIVVDH